MCSGCFGEHEDNEDFDGLEQASFEDEVATPSQDQEQRTHAREDRFEILVTPERIVEAYYVNASSHGTRLLASVYGRAVVESEHDIAKRLERGTAKHYQTSFPVTETRLEPHPEKRPKCLLKRGLAALSGILPAILRSFR